MYLRNEFFQIWIPLEKQNHFPNKVKKVVANTIDDLVDMFKTLKRKEQFLFISKSGIGLLKPKIEYKNVKIVDYILDEYYRAIGLVVDYQDNFYNIKFNVENTSYIDGIRDKFVRVAIVSYKGLVLNVSYNSELVGGYCNICGKYAKQNKVCYACALKLYKIVEAYNRNCILEYPHKDDFSIKIKDFMCYLEKGKLRLELLTPYYQENLPIDFLGLEAKEL